MQDFWEKGLHLSFKPPPEKWQTKREGHHNKDMLVEPMPAVDVEKTAAFQQLLARLPEDGQSFLERNRHLQAGVAAQRRLPKRLQGARKEEGQSASFWVTRERRPTALLERPRSVQHGSVWLDLRAFRVHAADPDADNSTGLQSANSSTESLTTTPPKSPTPKTSPRQSKCEEQIFVGNEGHSLMEEAVLQRSTSSIINSTQLAKLLLRKSLTNELVDKFYVSMQQVVQNLLDQPEFKAIICAYVEHTQHQIDANSHNHSNQKAWKQMRKRVLSTGNLLKQASLATDAEPERGRSRSDEHRDRLDPTGKYHLIQSELEGMPSKQGMNLLKGFYEDMCRCADLDSCRLSEPDAFWCYVDEGTLQGCKAEQVKLLKDANNRTWSHDLCSKRPCEPANLGMKPRPSSRKELDRQRHPELKEDNMLMRYGSDCDIWKTSDPLEWAFVGFDTTCVERTRRAIPKVGDWPKGLPYMFLSWTACSSNLLFDTKRNDGAVGALYQAKIRCTWYQIVLETFLILDLIFTLPMMVIMYYFIANRCADQLEVEQQFAPVEDSSDSSEEFHPEVPQHPQPQQGQASEPRHMPRAASNTQGGLEAASSA
ncbi:unnamed protein product [Symbiodinium pilosum]|uniref:Uncharacterized protein n=1 Tax=Symbiodinium pilosum TaxID=2952 RepID=A0A812NEG6_SYMPI|nr:unnamed protein product [Symbiodinium pilosum]